MASLHHTDNYPGAAPLMAIRLQSQPARAITNPTHPRQRYERFHQIQQGSDSLPVPPVVDHLVVNVPVLTFVSCSSGEAAAGVRVSSDTEEGADAIQVCVHLDTGLEVYDRSTGIAATPKHVPACGVLTKLKAPLVKLETAGYGSIQLEVLDLHAMTKLIATADGESSITIANDVMQADQISVATSGNGTVAIISQKQLHANYIESSADGCSQIAIASSHALANVARIAVSGNGAVDVHDVVAREAHVKVTGAGAVVFCASEAAHTESNGYSTATLAGALPPRITGRPTAAPELPTLIESLASSVRNQHRTPPPRAAAFEQDTEQDQEELPPFQTGFLTALKSLWTNQHDDSGAHP